MDFNPDEAIAAGWLRADSAWGRLMERLSRFSLREAQSIIALDRFMRDRMLEKGIAEEKIAVIPPWPHDDVVRFDAVARKHFRKAYGLEGKFVVMYSGNHSPVHPLDTLLQAAAKLRSHSDILFCFAGGGSEVERVKQWANEGKGNALCLPYQPIEKLGALLSAADSHVVIMGEAMLGLVHPCKIYNILTVGAPVIYIGDVPSHVTDILDHLGAKYPSIRVPHGQSDRLAGEILALRDSARHAVRPIPVETTGEFSRSELLPRLIAEIEGSGRKGTSALPQSG
jgi:glycosyltransferase involved in cell wall biosynthesis